MSQHMLQWQLNLFEEYSSLLTGESQDQTKRKIRKKEKKMHKSALKQRVKREQELKQRNYLNTLKTLSFARSKQQIDKQKKLLKMLHGEKKDSKKRDNDNDDDDAGENYNEEEGMDDLFASTIGDAEEDGDVLLMESASHQNEYN